MGRAIDMENRIDTFEHRLKLVEDALEELLEKGTALEELLEKGTKVHHVDLTDERNVKAEGAEEELEEEFRAPVTVKRKKRKATATTHSA